MRLFSEDRPTVSVVIPTYNRANFLPATIQSVLDQTFSDFEILVIDDGSTDNTDQIVRQISDDRVIYIRQSHSGLPAVGRNKALAHARGRYIAFLDSDDLWLPQKLARQVKYMDSHPNIAMTYTNAYAFTNDPDKFNPTSILSARQGMSGYIFEELYGNPVILNLTVMIRSDVVSQVGMFDENPQLKANEDYEYWVRIAFRYQISYIDESLALYRQHPAGISKAAVATNRAKIFLIEKLDNLYPEFVSKHPARRRYWLAQVHYSLGRSLLRINAVVQARRHFVQSWKLRTSIITLLFLISSYFGRGVYQQLDGLKMGFLRRETH